MVETVFGSRVDWSLADIIGNTNENNSKQCRQHDYGNVCNACYWWCKFIEQDLNALIIYRAGISICLLFIES